MIEKAVLQRHWWKCQEMINLPGNPVYIQTILSQSFNYILKLNSAARAANGPNGFCQKRRKVGAFVNMTLLNDWIMIWAIALLMICRWNAFWKVIDNCPWKAPLLISSIHAKASRHNCNFMEVRLKFNHSHPVNPLFSYLTLQGPGVITYVFLTWRTWNNAELAHQLTCFSQSKNFVVSPTKNTLIDQWRKQRHWKSCCAI